MQPMNRAQRRAMAKKKPIKVLDKKRAWADISLNMLSTSNADVPTEAANEMVEPVYTAMNSISFGSGTDEDFVRLVEANALAFCIAARIYNFSNAKDQLMEMRPIFDLAADALNSVGQRKARTGKYGFSGNELRDVRESVGTLYQLIPLADRGHLLTAMQQAADMVADFISKAEREDRKAARLAASAAA